MNEAKIKITAITMAIFFILPSFWDRLLRLEADHGMLGLLTSWPPRICDPIQKNPFIYGSSTERSKQRTLFSSAGPGIYDAKRKGTAII
jgi:hypothetical protein